MAADLSCLHPTANMRLRHAPIRSSGNPSKKRNGSTRFDRALPSIISPLQSQLESNLQAVLHFASRISDHCVRESKPGVGRLGTDDIVGRAAGLILAISVSRPAVHAEERQVALQRVATEIRMIEQVEEIQAELHAESLRQLEVLVDREIRVDQARTRTISPWLGIRGNRSQFVADQGEGSRIVQQASFPAGRTTGARHERPDHTLNAGCKKFLQT